MEKTFTVAGTSDLNGVIKFRFANSMSRTKVLARTGHTNISLMELPNPMTKEEAIQHLSAFVEDFPSIRIAFQRRAHQLVLDKKVG